MVPPRHEGVKMRISTDELTWDAKSLTFTGEASELERKIPTGDPGEMAGKLVGGDKILFNPKTGGEARFKYSKALWRDEDAFTRWPVAWQYVCNRPGLPQLTLTILND